MRRRWRIGLGVGLAVALLVTLVAVVTVVLGRPDPSPGQPRAVPPGEPPASSALAEVPGAVLAVKIDNVAAARPQTGLGAADVVYVEPVEGGLTRLLAVYSSTTPDLVGPVRSARRTDIELLAQYGTPTLAYSGAAPSVLAALHDATVVNASPLEAPNAYHRDDGRPAPHNLFVRPPRLPGPAAAPAEPAPPAGAVPGPGTPTARHDVAYPAAGFSFNWAPDLRRWLVSLDGSPLISTESGRLGASTVIVQRVESGTDGTVSAGSPVVRTVGTGAATVLRDGQRFEGRWTRQNPRSRTRFSTPAGQPLPLAGGPVWILLVAA